MLWSWYTFIQFFASHQTCTLMKLLFQQSWSKKIWRFSRIYLKYVESEKILTSSAISWRHQFLCNKVMSKNRKNWGKLMKIANIDRDFLHIFWTTWRNSMKFSGKICFEIILKLTQKKQGFTLSLEDKSFKKPQERHIRVKLFFGTHFCAFFFFLSSLMSSIN